MISGPDPWNPKRFRRIRDHWRNGGRRIGDGNMEIARAATVWFWQWDIATADVKRAEAECNCEAECVLFLGLAGPAEKRTIKAKDIIKKQLAFIVKDKQAHPEDYRGVRW